ncbi:hypothetical protein C8R44DRAFT_735079 [Mycena epipterygia]|nr:hypothetical protein C8R44DRAFT_735079 [Mycena epipterygia]
MSVKLRAERVAPNSNPNVLVASRPRRGKTSVVPPPVESLAAPASGTSSAKSKKGRAPTEQPAPVIPATTAVPTPLPRPKYPVTPADKPPVANLVSNTSNEHGFPILETRKQYKEAKRPFPEIACVWDGPSPEKRCEYRCSQDKMPLHIRKFHLRADWIRCLYCNEMFERKPHFWGCQEYLGIAVPSEGSSWKRRRVWWMLMRISHQQNSWKNLGRNHPPTESLIFSAVELSDKVAVETKMALTDAQLHSENPWITSACSTGVLKLDEYIRGSQSG